MTQAQFAGYYAAAAQGYYKQAGLDVNLKVGGPNITPETVVIGGGADIGLDWLPNLFATDEKGGGLVSVAQVFALSGMTEITWKSSGIDSISKMRGRFSMRPSGASSGTMVMQWAGQTVGHIMQATQRTWFQRPRVANT